MIKAIKIALKQIWKFLLSHKVLSPQPMGINRIMERDFKPYYPIYHS